MVHQLFWLKVRIFGLGYAVNIKLTCLNSRVPIIDHLCFTRKRETVGRGTNLFQKERGRSLWALPGLIQPNLSS